MGPVHPREAARLAALHDLAILDTEPEEQFGARCETARDLFQTPLALASLVGETEQWFKARCGIDLTGTARGVSFRPRTVMSSEGIDDADRIVLGDPIFQARRT